MTRGTCQGTDVQSLAGRWKDSGCHDHMRNMGGDQRGLSVGTILSDSHGNKIILAELRIMFYDEYCENTAYKGTQETATKSSWTVRIFKEHLLQVQPTAFVYGAISIELPHGFGTKMASPRVEVFILVCYY